jgi:hypothetical protein
MKLNLKILSILFCLFIPLESFGKELFQGDIVYTCKASGSNKEGVQLFEGFAPSQITINWNKNLFRLQEIGGLNQADIIADFENKKYYFLQNKEAQAIKASCENLDESPAEVKAMLPFHFKTELKPLEKEEIILGKKCKNYEILQSAFMRPGSTGTLCISEELQLPLARYSFETSNIRTIVPIPMNFINDIGSVMKVEILEDNVNVVCEITSLNTEPKSEEFFSLPNGYSVTEEVK